MNKNKKRTHSLRNLFIIFIFIIFNSLNALTVVNFLPYICISGPAICQVEDLIIFQSPPEELDQTETPFIEDQNIFTSFFPSINVPNIPSGLIDNFIPNLSTITEETTEATVLFINEQINPFIAYLNSEPSPGGSRSTPNQPVTPPVITDCSPTQDIVQNIQLSCYKGRRTYNTHLITLENTNTTQTCQLDLSLDSSSGPAVVSNLTTGNADIFFIVSTVENSLINLDLLPAPELIGSWAQWHNNPLQIELIGNAFNTPTPLQTFSVPPNSSRNLGVVMDCGVDTIVGETATIKLRSTFKD